jgi:hydrogenase maturation protease
MTFPRVVGLGSHHGDDQAGWLIIDRLKELGYPRSHLAKALHPAELLDGLSLTEPLFICDACQGNDAAGTVHRWHWPTDSLIDLKTGGTHDLSLPQILELAGQLDNCPESVEIWGIEGADWSPASLPGISVQTAAREVAAAIWGQLHA